MNRYSKRLFVLAAIFGLLGAILGGHMAGSGSYAFRPIHAHTLVVGWLSLFCWGVYYQLFTVSDAWAKWHTWTAILGSVGLIVGMWLHLVGAFALPQHVTLPIYIVGGTSLISSYALFLLLVIKQK